MPQTTAQRSKSIRMGSGKLLVDGVNIGLLDTAQLTVERSQIQIKAHNGYLPPKKQPETVSFSAEVYEIHPENLALIDDGGTYEAFNGTPVTITDEPIATWTVGTPIKLANKSADGTVVASIDVTVDGTSITAGTDYETFVLNGYSYIEPLTSQTGTIVVDYTYTPATSTRYTIRDVSKALREHEVIFENKDENGKFFRIVIPKGHASGNIEMQFTADDATDEAMKLPITFMGNPNEDGIMLYIEDEQAV